MQCLVCCYGNTIVIIYLVGTDFLIGSQKHLWLQIMIISWMYFIHVCCDRGDKLVHCTNTLESNCSRKEKESWYHQKFRILACYTLWLELLFTDLLADRFWICKFLIKGNNSPCWNQRFITVFPSLIKSAFLCWC